MAKIKKILNVLAWIFGFPFKIIWHAKKSGRNGKLFKILLIPVFIVYFIWMLFVYAFCSAFTGASARKNNEVSETTNIETISETIAEETVETTIIAIETEETETRAVVESVNETEATSVEIVASESSEITQSGDEITENTTTESTLLESSEVIENSTVVESVAPETLPSETGATAVEPVITETVENTTVPVSGDNQERHEYIRNANNGKIHRTSCSWGPEEQNRETVYLTDEELANSDRCHRCFNY